ncbi:MAG: hypothetical protein AB8B58_10000 [Roseobacter sp.]
MQTVQSGVHSLSLIVHLNMDRALYSGAILGSLAAASWLASLSL